jgi:ribose-phosphate pyrophosphokinase
VHAVLSGESRSKLRESPIEELVITDTIPHPELDGSDRISVISVAPVFAEAIRRIHSDDSVSSLFK